jgi:galactokinase
LSGVHAQKQSIGYAPGGAESLGSHTDYNDGLILGIGLEVGATVTAQATNDRPLILGARLGGDAPLRLVRVGGTTLILPC